MFLQELQQLIDSLIDEGHVDDVSDTVTLSFAQHLLKLVLAKHAWLNETVQGVPEGVDGAATPKTTGMTIDEFEFIKLISRGAFGRYVVR